MNRIHLYLLLLGALIFTPSAAISDSRINEHDAVKIISALPEIKAEVAQIKEHSSGKSRAILMVDEPIRVIEGKEYWVVALFEDNGTFSHRRDPAFLVSIDGKSILVDYTYDSPEYPQTLEKWRKSMRQETEPDESLKSDAQDALPDGWREPTIQEASLEGDQLRTRSTHNFLSARADFDGDGKEDVARLLVSSDGVKYALFVMLGSGHRIQLDHKDIVLLKTMGVDVLPPKTYNTACGKGYADCKEGDPKVLNLNNPGLLYFKDESAESVYYWPSSSSKPRRIWLSD